MKRFLLGIPWTAYVLKICIVHCSLAFWGRTWQKQKHNIAATWLIKHWVIYFLSRYWLWLTSALRWREIKWWIGFSLLQIGQSLRQLVLHSASSARCKTNSASYSRPSHPWRHKHTTVWLEANINTKESPVCPDVKWELTWFLRNPRTDGSLHVTGCLIT